MSSCASVGQFTVTALSTGISGVSGIAGGALYGGTGALGKTLLKRYYDNNEVIVFSRDEHKHYHLLKEYKKSYDRLPELNTMIK